MFIGRLFQRYLHHVKRHDQVMLELDDATKNYKDFEVAYKEFEVCWNYLVIVQIIEVRILAARVFYSKFKIFPNPVLL